MPSSKRAFDLPEKVIPGSRQEKEAPSAFLTHAGFHSGRSLLWETDDDEHNNSSKTKQDEIMFKCSMYVNQSESLRLDTQLRGWFQLDPVNKGNATVVDSRRKRRPRRLRAGSSYETALGRFGKPNVPNFGGGLYQMLIDQPLQRPRRGGYVP